MNERTSRSPVLAARQAGTATAFLPVARALAATDARLFAYPPAAEVWAEAGLAPVRVEQFADALDALDEIRASVLITGTSLDVADDAAWWQWARDRGVPSAAFVDQWVNYWQRFSSGPSLSHRFDRMPDVVAVVDDVAYARMVEHGCPPDRLVVTGTPALDLLSGHPPGEVARTRARVLAGDPDAALVVFAAEPESTAGSASQVALHRLADGLAAAAVERGRRCHLVVRLHPKQVDEAEDVAVPEGRPGIVSVGVADVDRGSLVLAADVVVGLGSVLLFESDAAGVPTISLTLGGQEPGDVIRAAPRITVVRCADKLPAALADALARPRTVRPPDRTDATGRFLRALGVEGP